MDSSATSFYSDAQQIDSQQAAKLKKLAKPMMSGSKKPSQTLVPVSPSPALKGMTRPEEIDDMLSELSTPGLNEDLAAQKRYIDNLINKGKRDA